MLKSILKFLAQKEVYGTLLIIIITYIAYLITNRIINKVVVKGKDDLEKKRKKTLISLFQNILKYIFLIIMILLILQLNGVNTSSFIAGLGIVGVVVGLGVQDALKDIIGGINIIMDNFFIIGDIVSYDDFVGTIIEFGLKSTKIQNLSGEVLIISNRNIDKIINLSQKKSTVTIMVPTAYEEKSDKVEKALKKVLDKAINDNSSIIKVEYLGIEKLDSSSVNYAIRFTCKRGTQWDMKRIVLKLIKEEYDNCSIKIPYDQLEVHNGTKL